MALILEDGSTPEDANSYATEDMADDYFEDRGNSSWADASDGKEEALIRATQFIDVTYGLWFRGKRKLGRAQSLEWPRKGARDFHEYKIDDSTVPKEVIQATCEAALRELQTPGSLAPDLDPSGIVTSEQVGSLKVTYASTSTTSLADPAMFTLIDRILANVADPPADDVPNVVVV